MKRSKKFKPKSNVEEGLTERRFDNSDGDAEFEMKTN
jgi:hypothetical protein